MITSVRVSVSVNKQRMNDYSTMTVDFFLYVCHSRRNQNFAFLFNRRTNLSKNYKKMAIDAISYLYAATVAAGGIIGYVKAGKFALNQMYFSFVLRRQVKLKMIEKKLCSRFDSITRCWFGFWCYSW